MKNIFKTIFIILLLQCGGEVLGMLNNSSNNIDNNINNNINNNDDGSNNNNPGWSVKTHTAIAILVWKLIPFPTWPDERNSGEDYSSWYVCYSRTFWQPQRLVFSRWDLKIGFFCFEHRTLEVIPKIFQAWCFGLLKEKGILDDVIFTAITWPISFSLVTIKWKCLRINWVSILEILIFTFNLRKYEKEKKKRVSNWQWNPFFSEEVYKEAKTKDYLLLYAIPRLAIDMSWFAEKNENEE